MKGRREKSVDWLAVALVAVLHALVVLALLLICIDRPLPQDESGVSVVMGNMGNLDTDYDFTEVESFSSPSAEIPVADTEAPPLVTQELEETVALESGQEKVESKPKDVPQPTAEELRAREEKRVADEANQLMQNLFGQSSSTSSQTSAGQADGATGSLQGNSTQGKTTGTGGFGTFDLNGRDVDGNGLQRPVYDVQDEGRVVVTITVNPAGEVISTSINKRTNTMNARLRDAAEKAARSTRFNAVSGPDNQTGTITYYFRLM